MSNVLITLFAVALVLLLFNSYRLNALAPTWQTRLFAAGLTTVVLAVAFAVQYAIAGRATPTMVPTALVAAGIFEFARAELVRRNIVRG